MRNFECKIRVMQISVTSVSQISHELIRGRRSLKYCGPLSRLSFACCFHEFILILKGHFSLNIIIWMLYVLFKGTKKKLE
jgi:hypothetical protein